MASMGGGRSLLRHLRRVDRGRMIQRRGMATEEEYVSFSQWRSGEKTYMQFQNANREYIVLGFFTSVGLYAMYRRIRKGRKNRKEEADPTDPSAPQSESGEELQKKMV
eukprot:Plantae.Rhodophyta-Purpureofilum_apyrenoidigerum.ctg9129.p3 GENE.Plantae.Rhodophyta-Purpureofilum_apyrenoidigerum.ctg9129~~Plantae.Rhodophyta-Purpureofilum_apyrenoidigerum.ctg9129.p3  ORF type:complete len:108 (-),score=22.39 Plantae.Rhodophyta-Purpureofilum_apyrenoidigerum.ctg9129:648-971(-)